MSGETAICPHCSNNLYTTEIVAKGDGVVRCLPGSSAKMFDDTTKSFSFAIITCPICNKILGVVNSSPIPIP